MRFFEFSSYTVSVSFIDKINKKFADQTIILSENNRIYFCSILKYIVYRTTNHTRPNHRYTLYTFNTVLPRALFVACRLDDVGVGASPASSPYLLAANKLCNLHSCLGTTRRPPTPCRSSHPSAQGVLRRRRSNREMGTGT